VSDTVENYWEKVQKDPMNYCHRQGEHPHPRCNVELYELGLIHTSTACATGTGPTGASRADGPADPGWPTELDDSYNNADERSARRTA